MSIITDTNLDHWTPLSNTNPQLQRGLVYTSSKGKSFGGSGLHLTAAGTGPAPIVRFTQPDNFAAFFAFGSSAHDNSIEGVSFDLGDLNAQRGAIKMRGARNILKDDWFKGGGSNVIEFENDGSTDCKILGGGSTGPIGGNFLWFGADDPAKHLTQHLRVVVDGLQIHFPTKSTHGLAHLIRGYGLYDSIFENMTLDNTGGNAGSAAFRVHDGKNLTVRSSTLIGQANRLGPMDVNNPDPWHLDTVLLDNLTVKGDFYWNCGATNITYQNSTQDSGGARAITTNQPDPLHKHPPFGKIVNVHFHTTNSSGVVLSGPVKDWQISGCTITDPTKGWNNHPSSTLGGY